LSGRKKPYACCNRSRYPMVHDGENLKLHF
jgi:hypothetical protein